MIEPDGLTVFFSALATSVIATIFLAVGVQFLAGHGHEILDWLRSRKPR